MGDPDDVYGCILICMSSSSFEPNLALLCIAGCHILYGGDEEEEAQTVAGGGDSSSPTSAEDEDDDD